MFWVVGILTQTAGGPEVTQGREPRGGGAGGRPGRRAGRGPGKERGKEQGKERGKVPRDPASRPRRAERDGRRGDSPPDLPADVQPDALPAGARRELRSLPPKLAELVARHLVAAERLLADDAELAYRHTKEARRYAARLGVVREACGVAAYRAGRWADAIAELRAARRLTGDGALLPVVADCERALGRPERALALARSPEAAKLGPADKVEMLIVESGARRDIGQHEAAVVCLQAAQPDPGQVRPWSARLFYAYADALLDAGRRDEARTWFGHATAADATGETDAPERLAELEGFIVIDAEDDAEDDAAEGTGDRHPPGAGDGPSRGGEGSQE